MSAGFSAVIDRRYSSLFLTFLLSLCGLRTAQRFRVRSYTLEERVGNRLTILRGFDQLFLLGIADEADLGEDRRHVGTDQDDKRSLFHSAVRAGALSCRHCVLNVPRQLARFVHLVAKHDLLHEILKLMNGT